MPLMRDQVSHGEILSPTVTVCLGPRFSILKEKKKQKSNQCEHQEHDA